MDFRPAYAALTQRLREDLSGVVAVVTRQNLGARLFKAGGQLPAVVVAADGDDPIPDEGRPVAWNVHAILVVHLRISGDDAAPDDRILELRQRIEDALVWREGEPRSADGYWTTLGGAVRSARLGAVGLTDDAEDEELVSVQLQVEMIVTPTA